MKRHDGFLEFDKTGIKLFQNGYMNNVSWLVALDWRYLTGHPLGDLARLVQVLLQLRTDPVCILDSVSSEM